MDLTKCGFTTSGEKKQNQKMMKSLKRVKKEYESKRQRTYLRSWEDEFPGHKYSTFTDDDGDVDESKPIHVVMMCQICMKYWKEMVVI